MAWLNTAPTGKDGKRAERPRSETVAVVLLPDNPAPYLIEWLFDFGPFANGAMGEAPVSYQDLQAWQAVSGIDLMPWEATLLRRLSGHYIAAMQKAADLDCPAFYAGTREDLALVRPSVDDKIMAAFGSLKKAEA